MRIENRERRKEREREREKRGEKYHASWIARCPRDSDSFTRVLSYVVADCATYSVAELLLVRRLSVTE